MMPVSRLEGLSALLPAGFTARPSQHADAEALADLANLQAASIGIEVQIVARFFLNDWQEMEDHFPANTVTVLTDEGRIVATSMLFLDKTAEENGYMSLILHPELHHRGLEAWLVAWLEQRMTTVAFPLVAPDVKIALQGFTSGKNAYMLARYLALGFHETRRFYRMQIDLDAPPQVVPLPDGYRYVPYHHPDGIQAITEVMTTAFRDHFGHVDLPIEEEIKSNLRWFGNATDFDPALFLSVEDNTGKLVACTWNFSVADSEPQFALVADVGVLRDYRGKGIARAMLTESFARLFARDRRSVVLGVDSANPSGALKLYQSVGMRMTRETIRLEKVLREGRSRATLIEDNATSTGGTPATSA